MLNRARRGSTGAKRRNIPYGDHSITIMPIFAYGIMGNSCASTVFHVSLKADVEPSEARFNRSEATEYSLWRPLNHYNAYFCLWDYGELMCIYSFPCIIKSGC